MEHLKVIIPSTVLVLQVLMKFLVGRKVDRKEYLELVCELPTNIIFLSVSFSLVAAFLQKPLDDVLVYLCIILIILALVVVWFFRECRYISDSVLTKSKIFILTLLLFFNYSISLGGLYFTSKNLIEKDLQTKTLPIDEPKKPS